MYLTPENAGREEQGIIEQRPLGIGQQKLDRPAPEDSGLVLECVPGYNKEERHVACHKVGEALQDEVGVRIFSCFCQIGVRD